MKYIYLLQLLILLLLTACKKDDEPKDHRPKCQTVEHAPQEFLDYWFFPKGSWWVYKLKGSNPAAYDTVTFTALHTAFYAEPYEYIEISDPCQMVYSYGLFHSNREHFAFPSTSIGVEGLRGYKLFGNKWVLEQYWDRAKHANEGYVFFYPFSIGEALNANHNWAADTNAVVTPSYTFPNSVTFMRGYYTPDSSEYVTRKIALSRGVGISYRRYYNGQEWELVNYHINQ